MIPTMMYYDDMNAASDLEIASLFNQYFYSVFTDSVTSDPVYLEENIVGRTTSEMQITESSVYTLLRDLDTSKAMGMDGIGHNVLKHCAMALYQPLCHLFQASLRVCKLPDEWKIHSITPIFKDGDKSSVRNYRPISLLSSVSKVMERLVYNHLMEFLANSISTFQYGFLKNHSCVQQLLLFYHELISGPNSPAEQDIVFLDFSKAFDSVPHKELLLKLKRLGVSGNIWLWLQEKIPVCQCS